MIPPHFYLLTRKTALKWLTALQTFGYALRRPFDHPQLPGAKMLRKKYLPRRPLAVFAVLIVADRDIYSENLQGARAFAARIRSFARVFG